MPGRQQNAPLIVVATGVQALAAATAAQPGAGTNCVAAGWTIATAIASLVCLTVYNDDSVAMYYGPADTVTTLNGMKLLPGQSEVFWLTAASIPYFYSTAGGNMRYTLEVY